MLRTRRACSTPRAHTRPAQSPVAGAAAACWHTPSPPSTHTGPEHASRAILYSNNLCKAANNPPQRPQPAHTCPLGQGLHASVNAPDKVSGSTRVGVLREGTLVCGPGGRCPSSATASRTRPSRPGTLGTCQRWLHGRTSAPSPPPCAGAAAAALPDSDTCPGTTQPPARSALLSHLSRHTLPLSIG